jgi:hypothetical protein
VTALGTERRVSYLPITSLPATAPLRFAFLFKKQRKWTLDEVTPYIEFVFLRSLHPMSYETPHRVFLLFSLLRFSVQRSRRTRDDRGEAADEVRPLQRTERTTFLHAAVAIYPG